MHPVTERINPFPTYMQSKKPLRCSGFLRERNKRKEVEKRVKGGLRLTPFVLLLYMSTLNTR